MANGAETVDCPYSGHNGKGSHDPTVGATSVAFTPGEIEQPNASASSIQIQGKRPPDGVLVLSGVEAPAKAEGHQVNKQPRRKEGAKARASG